MSLLDPLPWDANIPPTHINEAGIKWWPDRSLTEYARKPNLKGTTLPKVTVWFVEHTDGHRTRLITDGQTPEFENGKMEDIACHIDMMKLALEHGVTGDV